MAEPQLRPLKPIPLPDRHQLERLNTLYNLKGGPPRPGVRGVIDRVRSLIAPLLARQQDFNAALVEHINRNDLASVALTAWIKEQVGAVDDVRRFQQLLAARERRNDAAMTSLTAAHEELRASVGVLHQAAQNLKREVAKIAASGVQAAAPPPPGAGPAVATGSQLDALDSHKYVGFEDQFRGSQDDIRQRLSAYLDIFQGAQDVLDIGCGRGEFLTLLRERGVRARGIDLNEAMVEVCRQHDLDATDADALTYLRAQPDGSLGGLFAAQVIEHLEPRYLTSLLDAAFDKLRPGAPIVLETINPACWFAFFESYIRDITHVRPIHPDTLKYLLVATGFQQVEIRYSAPYPEHDKLQPVAANASLGDSVNTLNANVERINRLLFTYLDYAAIARRP